MKSFVQLKYFPFFLLAVAILCTIFPCEASAKSDKTVKSVPKMGINFAGLADWNTELAFVNVFRESREWISQRKGSDWGKGPALELDSHGWVRRLEPGCFAETPLCTIEGGHYPSGIYTVFYSGTGKLEFGNASVVKEEPGKIEIQVDSSHGAFWVRILETDPNDYLRDIRVFLPGFTSEAWNPAFLARWRGVDTVRFMDMQRTNGSKLEKWDGRPTPEDASYARSGAPIEVLCSLANELGANAWFCVPHRADDEFVRKMAETIRTHLRPDLKAYIEYSNEVWNGQFEQCRYACEQGKTLLPDASPWECGWAWTGRRSTEIFRIFDDVFGKESRKRVVRVLASQAANPYVSEQILKQDDCWKSTDVLAIAPYMGMSIPKENADEFVALGLNGVLDKLENEALPQAVDAMQKQQELARKYGLKLVCYEAGQHIVGLWGANDRDELNALCREANRSERMGKIYDKYFTAWENAGGDLLCHFSSTGQWSKWGSWGLLQFSDENPKDSPKYQAFERALNRWTHNSGKRKK